MAGTDQAPQQPGAAASTDDVLTEDARRLLSDEELKRGESLIERDPELAADVLAKVFLHLF
jgi:hypothetical protein